MNRIGIIRGSHLNKWEMQSYEPLKPDFDITCYTTNEHIYDISDIKLNIRKLYTPYFFFKRIPVDKIKNYLASKYNTRFRDNQYMFGLENHLKHIDLIHSVDSYSFSYQALLVKRRFNKKLVLTIWQNMPFLNDPGFDHREIKKALIKESDFFIATTHKAKEVLLAEGADSNRIEVVYPGIDLDKFKNFKTKTRVKNFTVIFLGRLVEQKGIFSILKCAKDLPAVNFILAGDASQEIKKVIKKENLNNINLREKSPYGQIPELLNTADVLILPSIPTPDWEEQFGLVIAEAMACAKPVIGTKTGSIPEVVGEAGILVEPDDAKALIDSINLLRENRQLRDRLSVKAVERAREKFDSYKTSKQIANIYAKVLAQK